MKASVTLMFALLAALAISPVARAADAAAAPDDRPAVVVYDVEAAEGLEGLAARITDALLIRVGRQPGVTAIGQSELRVMLAHQKDKEVLLDCEGREECLARLSEAADARRVVTGRVGKIGDAFVLTLKLSDAQRSVVARGESVSADDADALLLATGPVVDTLLGAGPGPGAESFHMAAAPQGTKVAVIDLEAHDVTKGLGQSLTQLLSLELKKFEGLGVISRDEIRTMLRFEVDKQTLQCTNDASCLAEIGGALGVDYLVSGSVGRLGKSYVISLKLMDIAHARVVNRVAEGYEGSETRLPQALRFATWQLLGSVPDGAGRLSVDANVDEGRLALDGEEPRPWPLTEPFGALRAGKHGVSMLAEGYHPLYQELYVEPDRKTDLHLEMVELPTPWYRAWWTWAIAGTVIAGAVTTAVVLSQDDPGTGTVRVNVQ